MSVQVIELDDQYYLNYCTQYLSRYNNQPSSYWHFPLIDTWSEPDHTWNLVSFIYKAEQKHAQLSVGVVGTFARLHDPISLRPVKFLNEPTGYYALTVLVPEGQVHRYRFVVNGVYQLDAINPQRVILDDKSEWSRFFTYRCFVPISFEEWEINILYRLFDQMLPFQNQDTENFFARYYDSLDKQAKLTAKEAFYRLDASVGEVNYVDKLLAKEENHHLIDYKICLKEIDRLLRQRNPFVEPDKIPREFYDSLYDEMASGQVAGWNYQAYNNPVYFLQLLRRHSVVGAFSHPKYGGNAGGAGWEYLSDRFRDATGNTLFDWRAAIERPLGNNQDYKG